MSASREEWAPSAAGLSVDEEEPIITDGFGEGEKGKNLPELSRSESDDSELNKSEDIQSEDDNSGLLVESDENGSVQSDQVLESKSAAERAEEDLETDDESGVVRQ